MSKFDKLVEKVAAVDNKAKALIEMEVVKQRHLEAIIAYKGKELLDDWWKPYYSNARESLERKVERIEHTCKKLREANASIPTTEEIAKL